MESGGSLWTRKVKNSLGNNPFGIPLAKYSQNRQGWTANFFGRGRERGPRTCKSVSKKRNCLILCHPGRGRLAKQNIKKELVSEQKGLTRKKERNNMKGVFQREEKCQKKPSKKNE